LIPHLHRLGPRRFAEAGDGVIVPEAEVKQRQPAEDEIPF
jgi:hypothetical protein